MLLIPALKARKRTSLSSLPHFNTGLIQILEVLYTALTKMVFGGLLFTNYECIWVQHIVSGSHCYSIFLKKKKKTRRPKPIDLTKSNHIAILISPSSSLIHSVLCTLSSGFLINFSRATLVRFGLLPLFVLAHRTNPYSNRMTLTFPYVLYLQHVQWIVQHGKHESGVNRSRGIA